MVDRWRRWVDGSFVALGAVLVLHGSTVALQFESLYSRLEETIPLVPRAVGMLGIIPLKESIDVVSRNLRAGNEISTLIVGLATIGAGLFAIHGGRRYFRK